MPFKPPTGPIPTTLKRALSVSVSQYLKLISHFQAALSEAVMALLNKRHSLCHLPFAQEHSTEEVCH